MTTQDLTSPSDPPLGRTLVIGGGGFIGQHVVAAFRANGADVTVMDMASQPASLGDIDWIVGSISDSTAIASAAGGCETVVFLANASLPGTSHAVLASEVESHVGMTIRVAEICAGLGVRRFIFASSGGTVYGHDPAPGEGLTETSSTRPRNAYGVSKLAIEHYLRLLDGRNDMMTLSLRLSNPYGEGQRAVRAQGIIAAAMQHAVEGTTMSIWGDGSVERDFIHVSDVCDAFVCAARYGGSDRLFNVGSGVAVSLNEIIVGVETALDRKIVRDYQPNRVIDVHRNVLAIEAAQTQLGWTPSIPLAEGLARTAKWWLDRS